MVEGKYNSVHKKDNIRQVRRTLKMTQKEFLEYFLMKENGKTAMSVATLSNLESKGGDRLNEVISAVSGRLQLDSMMFSLEPQEFLQNLETCLNSHQADEDLFYKSEKKGNISQLVNRLTMYFADEILEGRLKRGDQIESDRELAKKLNVGRSAVREALKVLDVLGMIDIRLGQGTYITSRETNFFSVPLSWSLFLDGTQVKSILQVRGALELRAVQLAAQCEDKNKLDKLTDIYYRMQKTFQESKDTDNLQHALHCRMFRQSDYPVHADHDSKFPQAGQRNRYGGCGTAAGRCRGASEIVRCDYQRKCGCGNANHDEALGGFYGTL